MTRRAFAVVVLVVVVLVAAAVGATWYATSGGSPAKTEGRCERTPSGPPPTVQLANGRVVDDEGALAQEAQQDAQARRATADQNPDECPVAAHWQTVSR
jgi:hypothetical protein